MRTIKNIRVPFDKEGNVLSCDNTRYGFPPPVWRDNYIFEDTLKFVRFQNMKTSVHVELRSLRDNREYEMFLNELERCIRLNAISNAEITGQFTFVKRGTNYSVSYVGAESTCGEVNNET